MGIKIEIVQKVTMMAQYLHMMGKGLTPSNLDSVSGSQKLLYFTDRSFGGVCKEYISNYKLFYIY